MTNKQPKICIPIKLASSQAIIDFMEKHKEQADLFEIWLDQIEDKELNKIFIQKTSPILCVCKSANEQGKFQGSDLEKIEILKKAIELGADYIDIDYKTEELLIRDLLKNKNNAKIILSYHNYELTPDLKTLLKVIQTILKQKPDIVKIATMANSYKDAIIILNLAQSLSTAQIPFIGIAMSRYGKLSRVMTPLLGGEMMFAPIQTKESSASGQIEVKKLKELWNEFS